MHLCNLVNELVANCWYSKGINIELLVTKQGFLYQDANVAFLEDNIVFVRCCVCIN